MINRIMNNEDAKRSKQIQDKLGVGEIRFVHKWLDHFRIPCRKEDIYPFENDPLEGYEVPLDKELMLKSCLENKAVQYCIERYHDIRIVFTNKIVEQ